MSLCDNVPRNAQFTSIRHTTVLGARSLVTWRGENLPRLAVDSTRGEEVVEETGVLTNPEAVLISWFSSAFAW
jgi:hypothetical protein